MKFKNPTGLVSNQMKIFFFLPKMGENVKK